MIAFVGGMIDGDLSNKVTLTRISEAGAHSFLLLGMSVLVFVASVVLSKLDEQYKK